MPTDELLTDARQLLKQGSTEAAARACQQALRQDPDSVPAIALMAKMAGPLTSRQRPSGWSTMRYEEASGWATSNSGSSLLLHWLPSIGCAKPHRLTIKSCCRTLKR